MLHEYVIVKLPSGMYYGPVLRGFNGYPIVSSGSRESMEVARKLLNGLCVNITSACEKIKTAAVKVIEQAEVPSDITKIPPYNYVVPMDLIGELEAALEEADRSKAAALST